MTVCNTIITSRTRHQEKEPTTLEEDNYSLSALKISSKEGTNQPHHSKLHQGTMIYTAVGSTPTHTSTTISMNKPQLEKENMNSRLRMAKLLTIIPLCLDFTLFN